MSKRELEEIEDQVSILDYQYYRDRDQLLYPTLIEKYLIWEFDRLFEKYKERPQLKYNKKGYKAGWIMPEKLMKNENAQKITKLMREYHKEILIEDLENY